MGLVTGITLPNNGDRIKAENYNVPITAILAAINGDIDSANIEAGSLPWEVMASFTNKIPAAAMQDEGNLKKYRDESNISFVASGCVWSITSGLTGAMTSGVIYTTDGARVAVSAITSKVFTASKDTYVDISPGGVVGYTEVANGAAPPSITTDYIRIAVVITSGAAITAIHVTAKTTPNTKEVARLKLGAAGTTIAIGNIPARRFLRLVAVLINGGSSPVPTMRFNNDSANNYSLRVSDNGAADGTFASQSGITLFSTIDGTAISTVDIVNVATVEKPVIIHTTNTGGATAVGLASRRESQSKWANSTDQITRIDVIGSSNFAAGSEVVVEAWD